MSCFTHKYPYSSNRELNLDWLIKKINARKVLNLEVVENVGGGYDLVIYFADSDPVTVHLFAAAEITAEDIYDLFEDSDTITKALNEGKISFTAESNIYPVIYGQTSYADALAALTAGKQLIAFYHEDNKYIQIPFKTKNVDTMNFSTVIDDIEDGKIVIRLALNQLTGWDSRIQPLVSGDDLLTLIDDTETIVADLNEDNHLELSASYENIVQPLARSLKTPLSAPAENKIVGFDENRDQMNLGIGNGLKIENDDLKINEEELPKQTPLTPVDSLPTPTEAENNKHLLYLCENQLHYIKRIEYPPELVLRTNVLPDYSNNFFEYDGHIYFTGYGQTNNDYILYEYNPQSYQVTTKMNLFTIAQSSNYRPLIHIGKKDENNYYFWINYHPSASFSKTYYLYELNLLDFTITKKQNMTFDYDDNGIYHNGNIYFITQSKQLKRYNIDDNTTYNTSLTTDEWVVSSGVSIGNNIYFINLNHKLIKYDTINNTSQTLLSSSNLNERATLVNDGNKILIIGGMTNNIGITNIYEFDIATSTLTEGEYNLTTGAFHIGYIKTNNFTLIGGGYARQTTFSPNKNLYERVSLFEYVFETIPPLSPFTTVGILPTANATEYAKHLLYLDTTDSKLKYIVFDGTYSYKSVATET